MLEREVIPRLIKHIDNDSISNVLVRSLVVSETCFKSREEFDRANEQITIYILQLVQLTLDGYSSALRLLEELPLSTLEYLFQETSLELLRGDSLCAFELIGLLVDTFSTEKDR